MFGIGETALNWFRKFHMKKIILPKQYDPSLNQLQRGPQGSVLGPVLFILFTNDMPTHLEGLCYTLIYADDTTLISPEISTDHHTSH